MGIPQHGAIFVELFLIELPRSFRPDTFRIEAHNTYVFCGNTTWCPDCISATAEIDYYAADYSRVTLNCDISDAGVRIANTRAELYAIIEDAEPGDGAPWSMNLTPTDIDFDHFVAVVIHFVGGSGGTRTIVESLTRLGNNLTVETSRAMGCMPTPDMAAWRIVLLVERSEMQGVTNARTVRIPSEIGDCSVVSCDGNCWGRVDDWFNGWLDRFIS
jgi:thiol-disulfide isomerase/thioredoxin